MVIFTPLSMSHRAMLRLPFLIHLLTRSPLLANQQWKISDDSLVVTYTVRILRLVRSTWNRELPVVVRW